MYIYIIVYLIVSHYNDKIVVMCIVFNLRNHAAFPKRLNFKSQLYPINKKL